MPAIKSSFNRGNLVAGEPVTVVIRMQKLAEICIRRPVFAAMIILALVVVGAASYFRLGVDRFPSVDLPTVTVRTTLPGASPEEVETKSPSRSKRSSTRSKASRSCVPYPARELDRYGDVQPQPRHRHRRPGCARPGGDGRSRSCLMMPIRRSWQSSTTSHRRSDHHLSGRPLAARVDRACGQGRQGPARTVDGRRRSARRRWTGARHQRLD